MGAPVVAPEAEEAPVSKESKRPRGSVAKPAAKKKTTTKTKGGEEDSRVGNRRITTDTYKSQRVVKDFVAPHLTDVIIFCFFK